MGTDENKALFEYLAGGEKPVAEAVVVAAVGKLPVAAHPVERLLSAMIAVGILAKDLHYRACGKPFYSLHELADIVWDVRSKCDELIETYYLGDAGTIPPPMWLLHENGVKAAKAVFQSCIPSVGLPAVVGQKKLVPALKMACDRVAAYVEEAKKLPIRSGVHAVLDEISKRMLTASGLLARTAAPCDC